ncbi:uncharacterized protein LOC123890122 [Trifolium pratense]|uniref:uncharacterized protein LOC123890122 n=1 Tax=Trifolium pratense TaxID=57577 RepID=UPI001E691DD3|nr:uncharacterized protein LOC123890122 [Trifolium pratense]
MIMRLEHLNRSKRYKVTCLGRMIYIYIYSKVQGPEKRGPVCCMGKIPKTKKLKASLSENQELRDKVKQMQEQQNNTNAVLVNVLSLIQNRFSGEDVNDILRAARQVTDSSSSPNQTDSPNPYTNED